MAPRFFVLSSNIHGDRIVLDDEDDLRHITSVLRLRVGGKILLVSEKGDQYLALIDEIGKRRIEARMVSRIEEDNEPTIMVTLFQGLAKGDKMDFIVRSATQLGVGEFIPLLTQRTVPKLSEKALDNRVGRWAKVAKEAAAQSGRRFIPTFKLPMNLSAAYRKGAECDLSLLFWEEGEGAPLRDVLARYGPVEKVALFIGPEGGFAASEVEEALGHGIVPVGLGPRILRTELAGLVALSIVMYELGGMESKR